MTTFTLQHLADLEGALASGELEVRRDGRMVRYRSIVELKAAHDLVRASLQAAGLLASSNETPSVMYAEFGRS